jgi:hypothetical protein
LTGNGGRDNRNERPNEIETRQAATKDSTTSENKDGVAIEDTIEKPEKQIRMETSS